MDTTLFGAAKGELFTKVLLFGDQLSTQSENSFLFYYRSLLAALPKAEIYLGCKKHK